MEPIRVVEGIVAPIARDDIDTDQIIPKQFLKRIERTGYGDGLFFDWRRTEGDNGPFVLDRPPWDSARVLAVGRNFGCGSSREHAVWALHDFGIRAIVAPSFADIFMENCFQVGIVPVVLADARARWLLAQAALPLADGGAPLRVRIDLESMTLVVESATLGVEPVTLGVEPATLGAEPATLGVEPATLVVEPATLGVESATLGVESATLGVESATLGVEPATLGVEPALAVGFSLAPHRRRCLMEGLDDIALTLTRRDEIERHEQRVGPPSWERG